MKTFTYLLIVTFIMLLGCSKDSLTDESLQLKKAENYVKIPKKCWLSTIPDYEAGMIECSPEGMDILILKSGWMEGHETYGGKMIAEKSPWSVKSCEMDFTTMTITQYNEGKHTMANGDYYFWEAVVTLDINTALCTAVVNCHDGVGRYKGATAEITLSGPYDFSTNVATFTGEGWWIVPR